MKPDNPSRWVRVTRQERDVLEDYSVWGDLSVLRIVEEWDRAPDDDGVVRAMTLVGSIVTIAFPFAVVALALYVWLS